MVKTSNLSNYTVKNNQTLKDVLEKIKLNKKGIVIVIDKSKKGSWRNNFS